MQKRNYFKKSSNADSDFWKYTYTVSFYIMVIMVQNIYTVANVFFYQWVQYIMENLAYLKLLLISALLSWQISMWLTLGFIYLLINKYIKKFVELLRWVVGRPPQQFYFLWCKAFGICSSHKSISLYPNTPVFFSSFSSFYLPFLST